jgi:hypothetical protein
MPGSGEFCPACARKHLCKAKVIFGETIVGHPADYWDVLGNLSEAEDHLALRMPAEAARIRDERKKFEVDPRHQVDFSGLLAAVAKGAMLPEAEWLANSEE